MLYSYITPYIRVLTAGFIIEIMYVDGVPLTRRYLNNQSVVVENTLSRKVCSPEGLWQYLSNIVAKLTAAFQPVL